ncbi:unnamed protein product [Rhizophagus irregularis]|nr:unnamed protein product [Rhizophagus irregularis]
MPPNTQKTSDNLMRNQQLFRHHHTHPSSTSSAATANDSTAHYTCSTVMCVATVCANCGLHDTICGEELQVEKRFVTLVDFISRLETQFVRHG